MSIAKVIRPIRFARLHVGSDYLIFAEEPSRGIRKSEDKTVYTKVCEAYSVAKNEIPERVAILMPEDLVQPLTRGV
jgi:hypothetical protein